MALWAQDADDSGSGGDETTLAQRSRALLSDAGAVFSAVLPGRAGGVCAAPDGPPGSAFLTALRRVATNPLSSDSSDVAAALWPGAYAVRNVLSSQAAQTALLRRLAARRAPSAAAAARPGWAPSPPASPTHGGAGACGDAVALSRGGPAPAAPQPHARAPTAAAADGDAEPAARKREGRITFSAEQHAALHEAFSQNSRAGAEQREALGKRIGLTSRQVENWFTHRREKLAAEAAQLADLASAGGSKHTKPAPFSMQQRAVLFDAFKENNYLNAAACTALAEQTGLTEKQIWTWFGNQRSKLAVRRKKAEAAAAAAAAGPGGERGAVLAAAAAAAAAAVGRDDDSGSESSSSSSSSEEEDDEAAAAARGDSGEPAAGGTRGRVMPPPLSAEQRAALDNAFSENHYPSTAAQTALAARIGLPPERVLGWFKYARQKRAAHVRAAGVWVGSAGAERSAAAEEAARRGAARAADSDDASSGSSGSDSSESDDEPAAAAPAAVGAKRPLAAPAPAAAAAPAKRPRLSAVSRSSSDDDAGGGSGGAGAGGSKSDDVILVDPQPPAPSPVTATATARVVPPAAPPARAPAPASAPAPAPAPAPTPARVHPVHRATAAEAAAAATGAAAAQPPRALFAAASVADSPLATYTLESLAPLCLRRSDLTLLDTAPPTVLLPFGGLEAVLTGAYVRMRYDAGAAAPAAPPGSYQLVRVGGCRRVESRSSGSSLRLCVPVHAQEDGLLPIAGVSSGKPEHASEVAAAAEAAARAPGVPLTRRDQRAKADILARALAAARQATPHQVSPRGGPHAAAAPPPPVRAAHSPPPAPVWFCSGCRSAVLPTCAFCPLCSQPRPASEAPPVEPAHGAWAGHDDDGGYDDETAAPPASPPRGGFISASAAAASQQERLVWVCPNCDSLPYENRLVCNKCSEPRPSRPRLQTLQARGTASVSAQARAGNWLCAGPGCGFSNFLQRDSCKRCSAAKPAPRSTLPPELQQLQPLQQQQQQQQHTAPGSWEAPPMPQVAAAAAAPRRGVPADPRMRGAAQAPPADVAPVLSAPPTSVWQQFEPVPAPSPLSLRQPAPLLESLPAGLASFGGGAAPVMHAGVPPPPPSSWRDAARSPPRESRRGDAERSRGGRRSRSRSRERERRQRRSRSRSRERHRSPRRYGRRSRSRSRSRDRDRHDERDRRRGSSERRAHGSSGSARQRSPPRAAAAPPPPPQMQPPPAPAAAAAPPPAPEPSAADDADVKRWRYNTPRHGVKGPFSLRELESFRAHISRLGRWATLRVWQVGQTEADAVLVTSLLG